jgi:hypothetical protein
VTQRPSLLLGLFLGLLPFLPGDSAAQSEAAWFVGGGTGFGWGTMAIGSDIGSASGLVVIGQVGLGRSDRRIWAFEVEAQPFDVPSPGSDEQFRAARAVVRRSFGAPFFLAPAAGVEYRRWSGPERETESDLHVALAVSFGRHVPLRGSVMLLPEIAWSYGFMARGSSVSSAGVSLRLTALRMGRR